MFSGGIEVEYWAEMGWDNWTFESIVWAPKSNEHSGRTKLRFLSYLVYWKTIFQN